VCPRVSALARIGPTVFAAALAAETLVAGTAPAATSATRFVARPGAASPPWLQARPGTAVRVDLAPWLSPDEPEAALTASPESLAHDFTADGARPDDIVYEPVGVRARILRVLAGGRVALVGGLPLGRRAYAPLDRLVPEIPPGTRLRAAGGFEGFADFFAAADAPERAARRLPTGSDLVALGMTVAPPDPDSSDLVRVRVRVTSGPFSGRLGWVAAAYTGIPAPARSTPAPPAEAACQCRLVRFVTGP
jgi:hypothetical protein